MSKQFPLTYDRYVEPFAGSAAFLFRIARNNSLLNDLNVDVINLYRYAAQEERLFLSKLRAFTRDASTYYSVREYFKLIQPGIDRSVMFYYLNRNCFNGIYRVNKRGEFNVPFSNNRVSPYLTDEQFSQSVSLIRKILLFNQDFELFIRTQVRSNDFVYLDPPYYAEGERVFNDYQIKPFSPIDLDRLQLCLDLIHQRGAYFLLTFPSGKKMTEIASFWKHKELSTLRSIAGKAELRRRHSEMMVFNYGL